MQGLHDRLLKYVMSQREIYELKKYEKVLAQYYPVQILTKYHDFLMKFSTEYCRQKNISGMGKYSAAHDCDKRRF